MIDCPLKAARSDQIAWVDLEQSWTYRELDALADRWVAHLEKKGIGSSSRIAVFHPPSPLLAALFFAAWRLQAVLFPLNLHLPPAGIDRILSRFQPDLYLTSPLQVGTEKKEIKQLHLKLPALCLMTSGSSGEPKLAVLNFGNLYSNAQGVLDLLDLKPNDRWLLNLPLFHVSGVGILIRSILVGSTVVTQKKDPLITHLSLIPTHLYRSTPVYHRLKSLLLGGAPIKKYPSQLPVVVTYGLTEMGSMVLAKKKPEDEYLGFPLSAREVRLSAEGTIQVKGPCLFLGYWKQGTLEKSGEWFDTQDLGRWDPKKGMAVIGRKDWQFISGGENIQPEEIEGYLLNLPGVVEAAVIAASDPEFGARPIAFIVGSIHFEQMKKELLLHLPKYKIPTSIFHLKKLPKRGFKIDRKALCELLSRNFRAGT